MGIDGLLRQLKDAVQETHLRCYAGQTVVVDAFSWLHKACYGCAFELATGKETDTYVRYMLRKVDLLRSCGIVDVVLVFDGDRLPLKSSTHAKRSDHKKENRELAFQSMADAKRLHGDARREEVAKAYQHFQKAVSITPEVINTVMRALKAAKIRFVVAPYEADAQMVWMCKAGKASAIVTEDSDMLVYCMAANADCHVLFKLDDGGMVQALSRKILHENTKTTDNAFLKKIYHLTTGEKEATRMFVQFCALAGCDFLESLPNMGVVTALKHIFSFRGAPGAVRVQRLLSKLSSSGTKVPPQFYKQFQQTESVFYHHIVFNADTQTCEFLIDDSHVNCHADVFARVKEAMGIATGGPVCLHALPTPVTKSFLGEVPPREIMVAVFNGERCSRTKQPLTEALQRSSTPSYDSSAHANLEDETIVADVEFFEDELTLVETAPPPRRVVAPKPVIDPAAEERRQLLRDQQRDATMRSLLNSYSTVGAQRLVTKSVDMSIELLNKVSNAPTSQLPAKRPAESKFAAPPTTVFSMKDLAQRHARTSDIPTPVPSIKTGLKPAKTPDSVKKRRTSSGSAPSSASKSSPAGGNTLFRFFQKK